MLLSGTRLEQLPFLRLRSSENIINVLFELLPFEFFFFLDILYLCRFFILHSKGVTEGNVGIHVGCHTGTSGIING